MAPFILHTVPAPAFSDGTPSAYPPDLTDPSFSTCAKPIVRSDQTRVDQFLDKLAPTLIELYRQYPHKCPGVLPGKTEIAFSRNARLKEFPHGYILTQQERGDTGKSSKVADPYVYGHPSGARFRSVNEFIPHLSWLVTSDTHQYDECGCKYCPAWKRRLVSGQTSSSRRTPQKSHGSGSDFTTPLSGTSMRGKPSSRDKPVKMKMEVVMDTPRVLSGRSPQTNDTGRSPPTNGPARQLTPLRLSSRSSSTPDRTLSQTLRDTMSGTTRQLTPLRLSSGSSSTPDPILSQTLRDTMRAKGYGKRSDPSSQVSSSSKPSPSSKSIVVIDSPPKKTRVYVEKKLPKTPASIPQKKYNLPSERFRNGKEDEPGASRRTSSAGHLSITPRPIIVPALTNFISADGTPVPVLQREQEDTPKSDKSVKSKRSRDSTPSDHAIRKKMRASSSSRSSFIDEGKVGPKPPIHRIGDVVWVTAHLNLTEPNDSFTIRDQKSPETSRAINLKLLRDDLTYWPAVITSVYLPSTDPTAFEDVWVTPISFVSDHIIIPAHRYHNIASAWTGKAYRIRLVTTQVEFTILEECLHPFAWISKPAVRLTLSLVRSIQTEDALLHAFLRAVNMAYEYARQVIFVYGRAPRIVTEGIGPGSVTWDEIQVGAERIMAGDVIRASTPKYPRGLFEIERIRWTRGQPVTFLVCDIAMVKAKEGEENDITYFLKRGIPYVLRKRRADSVEIPVANVWGRFYPGMSEITGKVGPRDAVKVSDRLVELK
ncbi:hypothetical protein SpCBS45565_g04008 [Spizellomyces sp. 'palustris']|nr:hypothetical protein SpCBS45565_g04008 [Spizellomyces sp. 'palustris']